MTAKKFDPATDDKRWMLYAVLIMMAAWIGLWGMTQLEVNEVTVIVFFVLLFVAVTATTMPAMAYLNARFAKVTEQTVYRWRFARQSVWIGTCAVVMAWLQSKRVLSLLLGLILIAVFVLVETFLITRETPQSP